MNDQVKIARIQAKIAAHQADIELLGKIIDNPIVELTAWCFAFEYIMGHLQGNILTRVIETAGSPAVFASGVGVIAAKQVAPAMPLIAKGLESVPAIAGALAPLLAAGA